MSKKLQILIACSGIFLLSFSAMGLVSRAVQGEPQSPAAIENSQENTQGGYLLQSYAGMVGVYYGGHEATPTVITEIRIDGLRRSDQALLEEGIWVETREEMLGLLEDFGS